MSVERTGRGATASQWVLSPLTLHSQTSLLGAEWAQSLSPPSAPLQDLMVGGCILHLKTRFCKSLQIVLSKIPCIFSSASHPRFPSLSLPTRPYSMPPRELSACGPSCRDIPPQAKSSCSTLLPFYQTPASSALPQLGHSGLSLEALLLRDQVISLYLLTLYLAQFVDQLHDWLGNNRRGPERAGRFLKHTVSLSATQ